MDTDGKYTEVMIKWLDCVRSNTNPKIYGDGSTSMDFVYVEDIANANIAALNSGITDKAYNIGCQKETSLKELLVLLLKVNNSDLKPEYVADNTVNPVSRRLADVTNAKRDLGFVASINLEEGLKKLSAWYFQKVKK